MLEMAQPVFDEELSLLQNVSQSLTVGLELAAAARDPESQIALLEKVLTRFGRRCTADNIHKLVQLAKQLHKTAPSQSALLLARWANESNPDMRPAITWLRAALLEQRNQFSEAAQVLEELPDDEWGEERALRLLSCARNLAQAGRITEAWPPLVEAVKSACSYRTFVAAEKLLSRLKEKESPPAKRRCKLALIGSVTLDLWAPVLHAACFGAGIDAEIYLGAFDQYQQEILDPQSALALFHPDIVILAVDWRALGLPDETQQIDELVREKLAWFENLWRQCRVRLGAGVVQHNFEVPEVDPYGRMSSALPGGRANLIREINSELAAAERRNSSVVVLDVEQTASIYGKRHWNDPVLWFSAKQYPACDALPFLIRHEVALLRAMLGLTAKCVALDLDGVLWGGVIGEDGLNGIRLGGTGEGEAYVNFQRYLKSLQQRGIALAVCSKNNEEDGLAPFRDHPEMVLRMDDIALFVANWETKDQNLRRIAATLNIGLDSVVFVDDNPVERGLVKKLVPEVHVPAMPQDPALYTEALHRSLCFEALSFTEEDRQRTASYRQNAERKALETSSGNVDDFLAGLQMRIDLRPFDEQNLARIVQLINKTNQFNLTTARLSTAEVSSLVGRAEFYTQYMRLRDRFGDSGITGVLIAHEEKDGLRIDNWLMSCRVLGRRIEDVMMAALVRYAHSRNYTQLIGTYLPTAKNGQVSRIYEKFGFERISEDAEGAATFCYRLGEPGFQAPLWLQVDDQTQEQASLLAIP